MKHHHWLIDLLLVPRFAAAKRLRMCEDNSSVMNHDKNHKLYCFKTIMVMISPCLKGTKHLTASQTQSLYFCLVGSPGWAIVQLTVGFPVIFATWRHCEVLHGVWHKQVWRGEWHRDVFRRIFWEWNGVGHYCHEYLLMRSFKTNMCSIAYLCEGEN